MKTHGMIAVAFAVAALVAGCGGKPAEKKAPVATITGAGATFPQPIYTRWAEDYVATGGDQVNYQGIGSGAGQNQIMNRTVDFGASDAPVDAQKLTDSKLLQFPMVVAAVVVAVNVPGVDENISLDGPTLSKIYLGKVKKWNDPAIVAMNHSLKLPDLAIAPIYRADSSGTTSIFTHYLAAVDPEFGKTVGADTSVNFKVGLGAPNNAGVAGAVKNTAGALGYVEYAYAVENGMAVATLKNHDGKFVRPTMDNVRAAAKTADWANAKDLAVSMIDTAGEANWPIVSPSYILLPKDPSDAAASLRVMKFFDYALAKGDDAAAALHYVTLPDDVKAKVRTSWCDVQANGAPVWTGCGAAAPAATTPAAAPAAAPKPTGG